MDEEYVKKLVILRLKTVPPDVSFSVGEYGDFTRNELIEEVQKGSEIGKATTEMELKFLRSLSGISGLV